MGQLQVRAEAQGERLQEARERFFRQGDHPSGLVDPLILRSWERCRRFGVGDPHLSDFTSTMDRVALKIEQERNRFLLMQSRPIMEHVFEQIRETGSMVILADPNGLILETVGDPDFVSRADRVALMAGASWDENLRGTNAIGTALAEESPVTVLGAEHFLEHNGFLTCCASPIHGPDGRLVGVLDISGSYQHLQRHTLGLVRLSSAIVEKRLFEAFHARDILVCFHTRPDYLGSPKEGIAAVTPDGRVLAINSNATEILGIRAVDAVRRDFSIVFESNLSSLIDRLRGHNEGSQTLCVNGKLIHVQLRGQVPTPIVHASRAPDERALPVRPARRSEGGSAGCVTLDTLNTGDARLQAAIDRARRMLGRDIPILIQGESGAGKEIFAKAFHNSGPRRERPFVALNCASIPETLIESELFGYQGGAFTGARKEGAPGKIQQADGGTLFLDEIGDMPLNLQARLLRVLQERCVTPLGSTKTIQVDIALVCATHRKLREEVARGSFREDLYYRLNGLSVTLPPPARTQRHPRAGDPAGRHRDAGRAGAFLGGRAAGHRGVRVAGQHPPAPQRDPRGDRAARRRRGGDHRAAPAGRTLRGAALLPCQRRTPRRRLGQRAAGERRQPRRDRAPGGPARPRRGRRQHLAGGPPAGHQPQYAVPQTGQDVREVAGDAGQCSPGRRDGGAMGAPGQPTPTPPRGPEARPGAWAGDCLGRQAEDAAQAVRDVARANHRLMAALTAGLRCAAPARRAAWSARGG